MKDELAERLLANIMGWSPEDVTKERPILQSLAAFKYDEYQQFSPGMRFIESLALWLEQFKTENERKIAYEFVQSRLKFISRSEINHLVSIVYPDIIRNLIIQKVAEEIKVPEWNINKIINSTEFTVLKRQCMFLGLSDGAHIDIFRRNNQDISHEQILRTHEISTDRAKEMIKKLKEDLTKILKRTPTKDETRFKIVFLLDDFSASGISYLRKENSSFKGKVARFNKDLSSDIRKIFNLDNPSKFQICLVLYVATEKANKYLQSVGKELFDKIIFNVKVVQKIPDSMKVINRNDKSFINLLKKYYDKNIETESYLRGQHKNPYLGFDECSLPIILSHNTPNNSVTLLWFEEKRDYRGLFPRVSRHQV